MVTINLTLLVVAGLFLGFLWLMNEHVFRPVLRHMDARNERMHNDQVRSEEASHEADALEADYTRRLAAIHRESSQTVYLAHRAAQDAHNKKVTELKKREEKELSAVRAEARKKVEEERQKLGDAPEAIAHQMAARLGLEDPSS